MIGNWPDPHPDELFYSICARFSERVRYSSKRSIVAELFGTENAIACVSLPSHLGYFIEQLPPYSNYDVNRIIDQHTLLPYFAPFLPPERYNRLHQDMSSNEGPALHMRAGLMASRVPLPQWLRFCPQCVEEDRSRFCECYWHRIHQVPGVEICPLHKSWLKNSFAHARNAQTRYEFVSAECAIQTALREQFNRDKSYLEMLFGLALDAQWLLNQRDLSQGLVSLQRRYRRRLADLALSTYRGRVDRDKLLSRFKKMYSVDLLKLLHCELDEGTEDCWLVRLAHKPDNAQHPLHHLLLIHCLEQNAEMFFHLPTENKPFGDGPWPCLNPTCHHYRQPQVCECIITYSPNVSGRPVGVFSCTCGFAYLRTGPDTTQEDRFKMSGVQAFGYIWEEKISRLWSDETVSLREMSRQLGVDPLTVKRHASRLNLPFPRPTSRTCQIDEKQKLRSPVTGTPGPITLEAYRTSWLEAIQAYQAKGIKFLRSQVPNTYTWLYRNDSVWLKAHLPLSKVDRKCREIRVDWQKRDEQLTEMVEASANRLRHQAGKPTQITLAAIGRDIGQLALLQQHLPKLPVTGRLLKDIIETREAFAIRRIQWIAKQYEGEQLRPRKWEFIKKAGVERIAMVPQVKEALEAALQNWHLNLADRQNVCC